MKHQRRVIPAAIFKAKCLNIMNEVRDKHRSYTITKRGIPIAQLIPIQSERPSTFGCMAGSVTITGDIVSPLDEDWNAENE